MASGSAGKSSIAKNVVYDSRNDVSTGKKRAVDFTGNVSVAERARLFGAQITHSNVPKNPPEKKPLNRNFPPQKSNADQIYSSPERVTNNVRAQPTRIDDRTQREPQYYSTVTRSTDRPQQRPSAPSTYDTFQSKPKKKPPPSNRTIISGEPQPFPENYYVSGKPLQTNSNYFQPIRDPLEVLYPNSVQNYTQERIPMINHQTTDNTNGMHSFDLGNLITRIQDDYLSNARPYVSSIEFIETELNPSNNRQNYSQRINDIYLRPNASYNYDIIDTNDVYQRYPRPIYQEVHRSSRKKRRRKHRRRFHDQASSPIHIFESTNRRRPRESPPPPSPNVPTPVPTILSEAEEETVNTKTEEEAKTTEVETSSESEEEEVIPPPKPVTQPPPSIVPASTPRPTPTTGARAAAKSVTSESSESDESDSDSEEDDSDEEEQVKPTSRPPLPRPATTRTAPATPQSNTRIPPARNSITNSNNITPANETGSARSLDLEESKKSGVGGKLQSIFGRFRRKKS